MKENLMRILKLSICLLALVFAYYPNSQAATKQERAAAKIQMIGEITRGSNEVFNCTNGLASDGDIVNCLNRILDENIQKDRDSAEFLMGAYFTAFARLSASKPTEKVKDKWLVTCFNRFSEIQKYLGFTDGELAKITGNKDVLPVIEKMRTKGEK
jgi:hypothetical protein